MKMKDDMDTKTQRDRNKTAAMPLFLSALFSTPTKAKYGTEVSYS